MKRYLVLFIVISAMIFLDSCSENEVTPTSLEISIKDDLGNLVSGASVELYSSQANWANKTNQIGTTQTSDASGKVKFTELSNIQYYWFIEKNCYNNVNGSVTTTSPLTANIINTVNSVLSSTGTLKFVNQSNNPYQVFINGTLAGQMNGGTTSSLYYQPTGSYSIRVLQVSGYVVYPTDKTYTGTLNCGTTLTTTFP